MLDSAPENTKLRHKETVLKPSPGTDVQSRRPEICIPPHRRASGIYSGPWDSTNIMNQPVSSPKKLAPSLV